MRPVLLIGSTGFLGLELARALRLAGQPAVLAARKPHAIPAGLGLEHATKLSLDATQTSALEQVIVLLRPRAIVMAAALARIADCDREPERARELNTEAPGRIAALCARYGVRLVHVSTDLVYGRQPPPTRGFREEDPAGPCSLYGETKLQGERAVLDAYADALVVRLPLLCGASHGRGLGASDSLLSDLSRKQSSQVFEDEYRTPLRVEDAAQALVELMDLEVHGLLHVAGPERLSRVELAERVLLAADVDPSCLVRTTRAAAGMADRPADCSLDSARACEHLPWLAAARVH